MQDIYEALETIKAGGAVVYPLFLLAIVALVIILDKVYVYNSFMKITPSIAALIENYGFEWSALHEEMKQLGPNN